MIVYLVYKAEPITFNRTLVKAFKNKEKALSYVQKESVRHYITTITVE